MKILKRLITKILNRPIVDDWNEWDHWEKQHGSLVCRDHGEVWELRQAQLKKGTKLTWAECRAVLQNHRDKQFNHTIK